MLKARRRDFSFETLPIADDRILRYIRDAGMYGILTLHWMRLDHALITALVERWRQETHTFHLAVGEATVTLQDVEVLTGLPVDGAPLIGPTDIRGKEMARAWVRALLGVETPPDSPHHTDVFKGGFISLDWLKTTFARLPARADDETVRRYARAYMLILIGGVLFPDKSNNRVRIGWLPFLEDLAMVGSYSWGAATLAVLYRELCKAAQIRTVEISGCLLILQLWAWERLTLVSPRPDFSIEPREVLPPGWPLTVPRGYRWATTLSCGDIPTHTLIAYRDMLDRQEDSQVSQYLL